jgi:hypothetical protein
LRRSPSGKSKTADVLPESFGHRVSQHPRWRLHEEWRMTEVYTDPEQSTVRHEADMLEGGIVLPGFALPLRELFAELDRQGEN